MSTKTLMFFVISLLLIVSVCEAKKKKPVVRPAVDKTDDDDGSLENAIDDNPRQQDLCAKLRCSHVKECVVNFETNEATCQCISECAPNSDPRRRVCSNHNVTWQSDCHIHRHRCLCLENQSNDCDETHKHMHIDYYGGCQQLPKCEQEVLDDFPRRMKDWLYTIMTTRVPIPSSQADAAASKWVDAVIWKFCDLDKHPHDRSVSRHELFPLRAPFLSMEPCISDFLDNCDANGDHNVTLIEWGQCLNESKDALEDKCAEFKKLATEGTAA